MPVPLENFLEAARTTEMTIELEPTQNLFYSLVLLSKGEQMPGLNDWVVRVSQEMTQEERQANNLVMIGFHYAVVPQRYFASFPAYIDYLARQRPVDLRDTMMDAYTSMPVNVTDECLEGYDGQVPPVDREAVLESVGSYIAFLEDRFGPVHVEPEIEALAYSYVVNPPAMQAAIVNHLRHMWHKYLEPEWERTRSMLVDSVRALRQLDLREMDRLEVARQVTGHPLLDEKWNKLIRKAGRIVFIPNPHAGPYVGKTWTRDTLFVIFGARLPRGSQVYAPDLSRGEILTRLNALADDTRLRILKYISERGEIRAQDLIQVMDLSQSMASRHLTQLTATGYLNERRSDGGKIYSMNPERVEDTLQAVSGFLLGR